MVVRSIFVVVFITLFASCAGQSTLSGEFATPVCTSDSECEAMWNGARQWLIRNTPYSNLRLRTATRLATHRSDDDPHLWAIVEKVPLGNGKFAIEANIRCGTTKGCNPSPFEALKSFNRSVKRAYISFD